jgi:hypothetical protein
LAGAIIGMKLAKIKRTISGKIVEKSQNSSIK